MHTANDSGLRLGSIFGHFYCIGFDGLFRIWEKLKIENSKWLRRLFRRLNQTGFTMVEVTMACFLLVAVAAGVWSVYWSVMNTFLIEMRGTQLQAEGERIIELMVNGGYHNGKRIYGLRSHVPQTGYPIVGAADSPQFQAMDSAADAAMGASGTYSPDYRITFCLDSADAANPRFAEFAVQLWGDDPDGPGGNDPTPYSTAILWFRVADGTANPACNYEVKISENLLTRADTNDFEDHDLTWGKADLLPDKAGIKISFYLADTSYPVKYNRHLERELGTEISNPSQRRAFMGSIPFPEFFSTIVSFTNDF